MPLKPVKARTEIRSASPNRREAHRLPGLIRLDLLNRRVEVEHVDQPRTLSSEYRSDLRFEKAQLPTNAAIQILQKAIELDPTFPRTHFRRGIIFQSEGLHRQAIAEFRKAEELSDRNPYYEAALAAAYADSGNSGTARQLLTRLHARARNEYVPAYGFAIIYAGLHDRKTALQWLGRADLDHSTSMAFARLDPALAILRSDRQFSEATRRLKF